MSRTVTSDQISEIDSVIRAIYDEGYYVELWERVYRRRTAPLDTLSPCEAYKVFNDFWEALPDTRSIRHGPFYAVCDMAEKYFTLMGDEYEDGGEDSDDSHGL